MLEQVFFQRETEMGKKEEKKINVKLKREANYLGTFQLKEIKKIDIKFFPSFFCLNLKKNDCKNKHDWVGICILKKQIIICDPLSKLKFNKKLSISFINLLHIMSFNRQIVITPKLCSYKPLYIFYIIFFVKKLTEKETFRNFMNYFSTNLRKNDKFIKTLFNLK